jgi:hypothetical protein
MSDTPTIGRIVWYRTDGRNGLVYDLPAIVTCTRDTHPGGYPDGSRNPLPVPDEGHVHLTVFTPGGFGTALRGPEGGIVPVEASQDFKDAATLRPGSGTHVEWNVPQNEGLDVGDPDVYPRTWRWPTRSGA